MPTRNNLRCSTCNTVEDCYYSMGQPPPCPTCNEARVVDWSHGHAPALFSDEKPSLAFKPGDIADKRWSEMAGSRSGQAQMLSEVERLNPGKRIVVEPPSHARKVEMEERRQSVVDARKAAGVDMKAIDEIKAAKRAKLTEQANPEKKMTRLEQKESAGEKVARIVE